MNRAAFVPAIRLSLRAALAAGLAVAAAELLRLPHPLYAMIGAVIVTDLSSAETRNLGHRRLWGSAVGAVTGAVLCHLLPPTAWAVGAGVLAAMLLAFLLRLQPAAKLAGYVCGIVVLGHGDQPWTYAFWRLLETALGIGAAVLVSFVPKLIADERK